MALDGRRGGRADPMGSGERRVIEGAAQDAAALADDEEARLRH